MNGNYSCTETWQTVTTTADVVIQCQENSVLVHTGAGAGSTGTQLSPGQSLAVASGLAVYYRAMSPAGGLINATEVSL